MPSHIELQIPGAARSGKPLEVFAPYDNRLLATVDTADAAAVDQALTTAYALFRDRSQWLSKRPEDAEVVQGAAARCIGAGGCGRGW